MQRGLLVLPLVPLLPLLFPLLFPLFFFALLPGVPVDVS
jgi:hypothetical protein